MDIKKVYTDNPFMDSLMYSVQTLAYNSIVKIEDTANRAETSDSLTKSDLYMVSLEGQGIFDIYIYPEEILNKSSVPKVNIKDYLKDKYLIPEMYRAELTKLASDYCVSSYIEENEYYRMICGLPPIHDYGIPVKSYEYLVPTGNDINVTYIHQLGADGCKMLHSYGILDIIKADFPDAKYLNYIMAGVSVYKARKAIDFQIIYSPSTSILEVDSKFASKYEINRTFVINTIYSQAFKISSDYYDNFIAILIIILTMVDMISEVQEHIVKKDILDARCIEYIFSMYGIPYYKTIPLKFQSAMCRNVNSLIKYKSCKFGMINLISLFGMNDIEVFKYFILRDRKIDKWDNFVYNSKTKITSLENDQVKHIVEKRPVGNVTIPFPFDYFLPKGNEMFIWLDDYRLKEGIDYEVYNYDKLRFKNGVELLKTEIRYDFYYDIETQFKEFIADTENGITMVQDTFINNTGSNVIKFTPPYPEYFIDKNCMIVMVGGVFIDPNAYDLDLSNNTITVNGRYSTIDRQITFIYLYGKKLRTMFKIKNVQANTDNQKRFITPEPFSDYIDNGNGFFITIGSTYIDPSRYIITSEYIEFTDITVMKDRDVSFHFIYSEGAIYAPVNIHRSSQTIVASKEFQYDFILNFPIEDYLKLGYKVYVKLRGWFLSDDYYDVYRNSLTFRDRSIALGVGESLEVYYVYGPTAKNIIASKDYRIADYSYQTTFDISYPVDKFFIKGNKVLIDTGGAFLEEGVGYVFSADKTEITIKDKNYLPYEGIRVNYTFVYNNISEYSIKLEQQVIEVEEDDQAIFYLNFPFYPYLETTQGFIALHGSLIIHPSRMTINKYNCTINIDGLKKGEQITILYIFNDKYLLNKERVLIVEERTVRTVSSIDDDLLVAIPVPFEDYIEHRWDYFVDTKRCRIDDSVFEVINNGLLFITPSNILKYDSLTFTFVYKETSLIKVEEEDYSKDMDLRFVKIPLNAKSHTPYLKKLSNKRSYNSMTISDQFWDGEENQDNSHEAIKAEILRQEFNYARTKYMTVEYLVKLTDMAFEIPYFYNMLYDDVFKEEDLRINIPTISPNKKFKLSHLFCYMTALAYSYSGINDTIMDTPTKILYVKGFNFHSDLETLHQYILDERRLPSDYDVFGFINPNNQVPSIEEFVKIYTNNKEVYKTICYNMTNAKNHDVYSIWKKLYDSLMVLEFNMKFFELDDGSVAKSFTGFLQEKDNVLYVSLTSIKAITDKEAREEAIVNMISDIVYILEEYLDSKEFKFIFNQFPGASKEFVLQYLFTMINFFKSYKVILKQMTVQFIIDDPNKSSIKIYDTQKMQIHLHKPDYITVTEDKGSTISLIKEDKIEILEKLNKSYYYLP